MLVVAKYTGAVVVGISYVPPIIFFGTGTVEQAIQTAFNGLAWSAQRVIQGQPEGDARWEQVKNSAQVTKGCFILTGVSLVPILGSFRGWEYFFKEVDKYNSKWWAYHTAQQRHERNQGADLIAVAKERVLTEEELEAELSGAIGELQHDGGVRFELRDLTAHEQALSDTLIGRNYSFTAGYYGTYYTYKGVEWGVQSGWKATCWTVGKLRELLSAGYVKRAVKFTVMAVAKDVWSTLASVNGTPEVSIDTILKAKEVK